MAAGAFVMYQHALEDLGNRLLDLKSMTFCVSLVSHAYVPSAKSHSDYPSQVSANVVTTAGYAEKTLASVTFIRDDDSHVAQDAADITFSASTVMKAKWAIVRVGTRPVYYCDLETTTTTGVEVTQLIIQFNALGIGRISNPN